MALKFCTQVSRTEPVSGGLGGGKQNVMQEPRLADGLAPDYFLVELVEGTLVNSAITCKCLHVAQSKCMTALQHGDIFA